MTGLTDAALRELAEKIVGFVYARPGKRTEAVEGVTGLLLTLHDDARDAARAECLGVPEDLARSGAAMFAKLTTDEKQAFNQFVKIARESARAEQRETIRSDAGRSVHLESQTCRCCAKWYEATSKEIADGC